MKIPNELASQGPRLRSFRPELGTSAISVHAALRSTVDDGPTRAPDIHELEPFHQEPPLDPDFIQVEKQFMLLSSLERLLVRRPALPLSIAVLFETLAVISSDPPPELPFQHIPARLLASVPDPDFHRTRDGVGLRELLLQILLQLLEIVGGGETVNVVLPRGTALK